MGTGTQFVDLGQMHPKWFFGHNLATNCQIFTNHSFYSEFYDQHLKLFFLKFSFTWRLRLNLQIWSKWTENGFLGVTWQPLVRFSQRTLYCIQSFMINNTWQFFSKKLSHMGTVTQFVDLGQMGPKQFYSFNNNSFNSFTCTNGELIPCKVVLSIFAYLKN